MIAMVLGVCATALPSAAGAHDIPNDVRVLAFFKPAGNTLQLLVRVPLAAMVEVDFPKRGPGYLDIARADAALGTAAKLWIADNVEVYEGEARLAYPRIEAVRASLPSDRSFESFASALAQVRAPRLDAGTDLYWNQGLLDVLLEYPIRSDRAEFSIRPEFARLGLQTVTALQFLPPGGASRAFE
ncbi:MAG: hypothetical protein JSS40_06670, partial [Proteobacteria bacterium]|nr:hypothetical protein [Pseudomonadota bacterium]